MNERPSRADFAHFHEMSTRWSDCDMLGHVNNARFLTFDESARVDYFDALIDADPGFWKDTGFILAHLACDFIAQLHHPSLVRVGFRIVRIGRSSMNTVGALFVGDELVAATRGVLVWFDYRRNQSAPVPPSVRDFIRARERIAPQES